FQAEDGIRDRNVTGVQTCALPILVTVAQQIGTYLAQLGVGQAFGVVGSGNFEITNALRAAGVPFVATRHEGGAATMADAYSRMKIGRASCRERVSGQEREHGENER